MEPKKNCSTCLHEEAPCCPYDRHGCWKHGCWKPGPGHWKEKFQDKTRNGHKWEVRYKELHDRLYGRVYNCGVWQTVSWSPNGRYGYPKVSGFDLLPREPDIYQTKEWEKYKEVMGLVATNEDYKANFKKFYNAKFRLKEEDEKET